MTALDASSYKFFSPKKVYYSSSQGLLGWLYQGYSRNRAFVTKGFFLRKTDRQFFINCREALEAHFSHDIVDWLSNVHNGNTRLGFLLLHSRKSGNDFIEGATFSLQTVSAVLPNFRDCLELIIEPMGKSCRVGIHLAIVQSDESIKHSTVTEIVDDGLKLGNMLDEFVTAASIDLERQWESWSHWWLKEAKSLPIDVPKRFAIDLKNCG